MNVAVQIISGSHRDFAPSKKERDEIAKSVESDLCVSWLPPTEAGHARRRAVSFLHAPHAYESVAILVLLGVGLNAVIKPFVEEIATGAGKDAWKALKRVVLGVWRGHASRADNLKSKAFIVAEIGEDFAAIELRLPSIPAEDESREAAIQACIDEQITTLKAAWPDIQKKLDACGVGNNPTSQLCVIYDHRGCWSVRFVETTEFMRMTDPEFWSGLS